MSQPKGDGPAYAYEGGEAAPGALGVQRPRPWLAAPPPVEPAAAPPSASSAAAADETVEIAVWGSPGAGKTMLLAQLYNQTGASEGWDVFPDAPGLRFVDDMRESIQLKARFPKATELGAVESMTFTFRHRQTGRKARAFLCDRAGALYQRLDEEVREALKRAHGLVLLFDPADRVDGALLRDVARTLEAIHAARGEVATQDTRPIAICLTKSDRHIHTVRELRRASQEPRRFVEGRLSEPVLGVINRYCAHWEPFPVSAVGLRLEWGSIRPVVFFDDQMAARVGAANQPLNLMAPFSWLFEQLGGNNGD